MKGAQGFALMLAVFLTVVLSAIALYLITISTGQVAAVAQDYAAAQAYQAARSGIEWGAYRVLVDNACPGPTTLNVGSGYIAEVTCTQIGAEREGETDVLIYEIGSLACNAADCVSGVPAPSPTYVERELELVVSR